MQQWDIQIDFEGGGSFYNAVACENIPIKQLRNFCEEFSEGGLQIVKVRIELADNNL